MGKCKLRIRRLTLATRAGSEEPDEDDDKADDDERLLAGEYMHQALEISVASSSSRVVRPHIHGVEDRIGGRFWAMPSDSESDSEEVDQLACSMNMLSINSPLSQTSGKSLSSPETSGAYHKKGAVSPVVAQADGGSTGGRVTGVMSSKAAKAASKKVIRPWEGPLPPPRMSPKLSFGDILEKAKVSTMSSSILTDGCSMSSEFRRSPETRYPMHARSESQGSKAKLARQVEFEITNSNSTQVPHASAGQGQRRHLCGMLNSKFRILTPLRCRIQEQERGLRRHLCRRLKLQRHSPCSIWAKLRISYRIGPVPQYNCT
jgi:hypothetical protein